MNGNAVLAIVLVLGFGVSLVKEKNVPIRGSSLCAAAAAGAILAGRILLSEKPDLLVILSLGFISALFFATALSTLIISSSPNLEMVPRSAMFYTLLVGLVTTVNAWLGFRRGIDDYMCIALGAIGIMAMFAAGANYAVSRKKS